MADRWLALLRGDVDVVDGSHDTVAKFITGSPGTRPVLALTSSPLAEFPGTPHLAGPDGLIAQRSGKLDAATRRTRLELALLAAELSASERTVVVPKKAPAPVRACLEQSVGQALGSNALREAAARQGQALEPTRAPVVREQLARIEAAVSRNLPVLKKLAASAGAAS